MTKMLPILLVSIWLIHKLSPLQEIFQNFLWAPSITVELTQYGIQPEHRHA